MFDLFVLISLFFIGASLGSFFTLVGSRSVLNESIIRPRSHCANCAKQLKWYELIPTLSFFIVRGRCLNCDISVPISYVITEGVAGLLFICCVFLSPNKYCLLILIGLLCLLVLLVARKVEKSQLSRE